MSYAAGLGALVGAGLAWWNITHGRPPRADLGVAENVISVAIGLGFLSCVAAALIVVPLCMMAHFRNPAPEANRAELKASSTEEAQPAKTNWLLAAVFVVVFALLGMAGGALEPLFRQVSSPTDNATNLTLGMAALGAMVGGLWVRLERTLAGRQGDPKASIHAARRRLIIWTVVGFLALGALGMSLIGGPLLLLQFVMPQLGFKIAPLATRDFVRITGMGLIVGGGWGAFAGLLATFVRTQRRP